MTINMGLLCLVTRYKNFLSQKEVQIKMFSVLNVFNNSSKPEEFRILKDIEVVVDSKEQNWFKRAHVGKFLGLPQTEKLLVGLDKCKIRARNDFDPTHTTTIGWPGPENHQNKFLSAFGVMYVTIKSQKDKGKTLKKHILKDFVPRGFDAKIEEIQGKHQQAIEEKDATIALLNDDLKNRKYENVGLQGEIKAKDQQIAALQKPYVGYLSDEGKNNGISIIAKNNDEAEYPYISLWRQHGCRRHKVRVLLTRKKGIYGWRYTKYHCYYNFWRDYRLIVVDPNRPRHFRLDTINQEQLLALNDM